MSGVAVEFSGLAQEAISAPNDAMVRAKSMHVSVLIQRTDGLTDRLSMLADKLLGGRADKGNVSVAPAPTPTVSGEMGVLTSVLYEMDGRLDRLGNVVSWLEQLA